MRFVENIRVGAEGVEASFGAEIDRPAAIFEPREMRGVGVAKDPPAEGDKAQTFLLPGEIRSHSLAIELELPQ